MKKFLLTTLSVLALSAGAAQAQDRGNFNISILGGWSAHPALMINGSRAGLEDGYNVGARLGYDLSDTFAINGLSIDADYFYNQSDYMNTGGPGSGARLGSSSFMGDLIYHLPTSSPWGLYGGAGLGVVNDNLHGSLHGSSTVMGWQGIGGVDYALNPMASMFVEYRYQNAHDANLGGLRNVGNTSNNVSVGVKFNL